MPIFMFLLQFLENLQGGGGGGGAQLHPKYPGPDMVNNALCAFFSWSSHLTTGLHYISGLFRII